MHDKPTDPGKSTTLVNLTEGTNKEIPRQRQRRWKLQTWNKPTDADRSTMTVNPTEEADRNFPPMPKASLHAQASANHHIEDAMGHDMLSSPINIEDLGMN